MWQHTHYSILYYLLYQIFFFHGDKMTWLDQGFTGTYTYCFFLALSEFQVIFNYCLCLSSSASNATDIWSSVFERHNQCIDATIQTWIPTTKSDSDSVNNIYNTIFNEALNFTVTRTYIVLLGCNNVSDRWIYCP